MTGQQIDALPQQLVKVESVKPSAVTPSKSKLARKFAKVLNLRAVSGIVPDDGIQRVKEEEKHKSSIIIGEKDKGEAEKALEAMLAKLFASISTVKASYAQLQFAQSPYDVDGINDADQALVAELKNLSELNHCYAKKQFDALPVDALVLAEIQEQKSILKTYEITGKKLEVQVKRKEFEIAALREKLEEANRHNKLLEKRLNQSEQLSIPDNLYLSGISPKHFSSVLRHTVRSVQSFVRLLIDEMKSAGWDVDAAANSIHSGCVYWKPDHKCFAFESLVCTHMFSGFNLPNFSLTNISLPENKNRNHIFEMFREIKSVKAKEYLAQKPKSAFARFCKAKYLRLVHPQMESAFFGTLNQRNLVNACKFPETSFFSAFTEMAKRVWLLHCLAFSFEPAASIFTISRGNRFSEVYMESVADEPFISANNNKLGAAQFDPRVAFTVVPGFKIGQSMLQSQVYVSQLST